MSRKKTWFKLLKAEVEHNEEKAKEYWYKLMRKELDKKKTLEKNLKK